MFINPSMYPYGYIRVNHPYFQTYQYQYPQAYYPGLHHYMNYPGAHGIGFNAEGTFGNYGAGVHANGHIGGGHGLGIHAGTNIGGHNGVGFQADGVIGGSNVIDAKAGGYIGGSHGVGIQAGGHLGFHGVGAHAGGNIGSHNIGVKTDYHWG